MASHISKDFEARLGRIAQSHKAGGGFEAFGALGRLDQAKPRRSRSIALPLRALVLLAVGFFLFKAALMAEVGEHGYMLRLQALCGDGGLDAVVAFAMAPDMLSDRLAGFIRQVLH